jgi:AmmeMemoRadiSam system protein B
MLAQATCNEVQGEILGLIVPHAGHIYSGQVAASAFRCVRGEAPEAVVVVSPLHQLTLGQIATTSHEAYWTPLGDVPVSIPLITQLERELLQQGIELVRLTKDGEHAVEIELPFLLRTLKPTFQFVPIMMRDQSKETAQALGQALANTLKDVDVLLVASSDLSHFHPANQAEIYDREVLRRIEAYDPIGLTSMESEGVGFACGRGAMASVLWAAQALGATRTKILQYAHSGHVTEDYSSVVGYGSAAILRE